MKCKKARLPCDTLELDDVGLVIAAAVPVVHEFIHGKDKVPLLPHVPVDCALLLQSPAIKSWGLTDYAITLDKGQ